MNEALASSFQIKDWAGKNVGSQLNERPGDEETNERRKNLRRERERERGKEGYLCEICVMLVAVDAYVRLCFYCFFRLPSGD